MRHVLGNRKRPRIQGQGMSGLRGRKNRRSKFASLSIGAFAQFAQGCIVQTKTPLKEPPHGSESFRRINPHLFGLGGVQPKVTQQKVGPALDGKSQGRKEGGYRLATNGPILRVTLISFRSRLLDSDNLAGGFKPLRDAIARWLGLDDSDKIIEWECGQILTRGKQGTAVRIERL